MDACGHEHEQVRLYFSYVTLMYYRRINRMICIII